MEAKPQNQKRTSDVVLQILRNSIEAFQRWDFHLYNSKPTLNALFFSFFILIHISLNYIYDVGDTIHRRLQAVLLAAGFPVYTSTSSSQFHLLNLDQFLSTTTILFVPTSSYFLIRSKSLTIDSLKTLNSIPIPEPSNYSILPPLEFTHTCNYILLVAANSSGFYLLRELLTPGDVIASGVYSLVVSIAVVICNLALNFSGWERKGGFRTILRAFLLIRSKIPLAIALALPTNLAMAAVEKVFRCNTECAYEKASAWGILLLMPATVLVAYMYAVLIVGDTVVGCFFYLSLKEEEEGSGG